MIHVYGKYKDASTVQFEAYRKEAGTRVQEAQLAFRLNNSRLLHARAYLRPEPYSELSELLNQEYGISEFTREVSKVTNCCITPSFKQILK